jgi:hypothetical protein
MTREQFIKELEGIGYSYRIVGDKISVAPGFHGSLILNPLIGLPSSVEFSNGGDVMLGSLTGGWFGEWEGNIKGIESKGLLNKMISLGLFEKGI